MNNNDKLKKKILDWLSDQGYPLEMRVATSFQESGFNVLQSHYYSDPEGSSFREIDIIATAPEYTGITNISFAVECKSSKKKPWILFTSDHVLKGWNILFSYCINSDSAREALVEKGIEQVTKLPWMKKEGRISYGITQAFTSGEDLTFKTATSALKAAISMKKNFDDKSYSPFVFVFPVIVLEGKAFECFIDINGEPFIQEFYKGFYFFPLNIAGEFGTCVQILTVDRLADFIHEAKDVSDSLISLLKSDADKKLKSI